MSPLSVKSRTTSLTRLAALAACLVGCLASAAMAVPVNPTHAWYLDTQTLGTTPAAYGTHSGTLFNTPALSGDTPFVYAGNNSFLFAAADQDYVQIADAADLRPGTGAWSTSFWFKTSGSQFGAMLAKQDSGINNY